MIKAAAVGGDPRPQRHLHDLAFLCSLVADPLTLRADLTTKDRTRLRAVTALADPGHQAWRQLDEAEPAYAVYRLLTS